MHRSRQHTYLLIAVLSISIITCGRDNPMKTTATIPFRVTVTPDSAEISEIGETTTLAASVVSEDGTAVPDAAVSWRSSDPDVATVSEKGVVQARGYGSATITAQSGQKTGTVRVTVNNTTRTVLKEIYNATGGENWTNSTNWLSANPVGQWHGVTTGAATAEGLQLRAAVTGIQRLDLSNNNMTGEIPAALGRLTGLRYLDLSGNALTGEIPAALGNLTNLVVLKLHDNAGLTGPLPSTFTNLAVLDTLNVQSTRLCAPADTTFQEWLDEVDSKIGVFNCGDPSATDRTALIALYEATDGPTWTDSSNWLTAAGLSAWHGVYVNAEGRVDSLILNDNNLTGEIPAAVENLTALVKLDLRDNQLSGEVPLEVFSLPNLVTLELSGNQFTGGNLDLEERDILIALYETTDGPNWTTSTNWLSDAPLGEWYGVTTDAEGRVVWLQLASNGLTGAIPSELGQLTNLERLRLDYNSLTGSIPPELGQLTNLLWSTLAGNDLTGSIPPELGQLTNLTVLWLQDNDLTGSIPPELGQLTNLLWSTLAGNDLTGSIPPELGQLTNLTVLWLQDNDLTGSIPPELGQLTNLQVLNLFGNDLTGEIPPELGRMRSLIRLNLSYNDLMGAIPPELGQLTALEEMDLTNNTDVTGSLPPVLKNAPLEQLLLGGTGVCAPTDFSLQDWLRQIVHRRVMNCDTWSGRSAAYIVQATQSIRYPVPLVAGEEALLRVFVTVPDSVDTTMPAVRAILYTGSDEHVYNSRPDPQKSVPSMIDEDDLEASVNFIVPAHVIAPGLEMVVYIDAPGFDSPFIDPAERIPSQGRMSVDVHEVASLELTLVPFLWSDNPDHSLVDQVNALTSESDIFRFMRDILPVREFNVHHHDPVWTSVEPIFNNSYTLLREIRMLYEAEGATGYYMGVMTGGGGGIAFLDSPESVSILHDHTIAHELGHNFSLRHVPCGDPLLVDSAYPYADGTIGAWGYDSNEVTLVDPQTPEIMSYCGPPNWISDYQFTRAMGWRVDLEEPMLMAAAGPSTKILLVWGGVDEHGDLFLDSAFVLDAPLSLPRERGDYEIIGEDKSGAELFRLSFEMSEVQDREGGAFTFMLPVHADWPSRLDRISLTGPEGDVEIGRNEEESVALLIDQVTGRIRGVLRDWPPAGESLQSARRTLPEPGLEIIVSRGIPEPADW